MNNGLNTLLEYSLKAVDLSRRNRLLKTPTSAKLLSFKNDLPSFLNKFGALDNLSIEFSHQELLHEEKRETEGSLTNIQGEKLIEFLNMMRLAAKRDFEEHGLHTLFLTFGRVKWSNASFVKSNGEHEYNAPLLLLPIFIKEKKSPKKTVITHNAEFGDVQLNKAVSLLLETTYNASPLTFDNEEGMRNLNAAYQKLLVQARKVFLELHVDFELIDQIQIGHYFFSGQQIYQDLNDHKKKIIQHDVINALCSHDPLMQKTLNIHNQNYDDHLREATDFSIMDADKSQLSVIQNVMNKNHLTIQGPPGTGKSQTIVNTIAHLLAQGKRVLVVCEKQVALQVVFDRLKQRGLHKLCLSLFDYGTDKKTFARSIIEDREALLKSVAEFPVQNHASSVFSQRAKKIKRLQEYAETLGTIVEPLGQSVQWVHGQLARYQNENKYARFKWNGNDPLKIDRATYQQAMVLLNAVTPIFPLRMREQFYYWNLCTKKYFSPHFADDYFHALNELKSCVIAGKLLVEDDKSITTLHALTQLCGTLKELNVLKKTFEQKGIDFEKIDPKRISQLARRFSSNYASVFRFVSSAYYSDCKKIRDWCATQTLKRHQEYVELLRQLERYTYLTKKIEMLRGPKIKSLENWFTHYEKTSSDLEKVVGTNRLADQLAPLSFAECIQIIEKLIEDKRGLEQWISYQNYARQLQQLGQGWFLDATKDIEIKNPAAAFAHSLWSAWIDAYYARTPELQKFTQQEHQQTVVDFKTLEHATFEKNAARILAAHAAALEKLKKKSGMIEKQLVHQSQLKIRHKPIRKLVQEIGPELLNYKPCWMMSPLTVSSYIPFGLLEFDVVIFDEASQMRVEHALGAIARAKQVVIFGDENQLPPTDFFQAPHSIEESDEEFNNDYESILQAAQEVLPGAHSLLSYHYRSKYEDLISFSNHHFYDDELITFPNPHKAYNAVKFEYVQDGTFDGGKDGGRINRREAVRVAQICIDKMKNEPAKTLGVISFSKTQENAIRDALQQLLKEHPECKSLLDESSEKLSPFFIKNLESVQGDERDCIILSVGYGRDKSTGQVYNRFGPLNGVHGYRRLNVAATRAKEELICVSSITSADIRLYDDSRGAQLLKNYLEYAQTSARSFDLRGAKKDQVSIFETPFEDEVAKTLEERGYVVYRAIGASGFKIDLAIVDPKNSEKYVLAIECDGPSYHSSYNARMNDRMRQEILKKLGWNVYRIWSQHWLSHKEEIMDQIATIIAQSASSNAGVERTQ
ncbi:MAG TPA: AAA domain-containing protein [Candidatus Babeliales bacterium]|nr:AAA domain-containing protein [Candidatus Babeliales bacterium]